jgi:hypothetical protein
MLRRASDHTRALEKHIDLRLRERRKQTQRDEEIAETSRVFRGQLMCNHASRSAVSCRRACDKTGFVCDSCAGVGKFDLRAVCDRVEESEEGDLMGRETGRGV